MFGTGWRHAGYPDRQPKDQGTSRDPENQTAGAGAALLLSTGAALAIPATAQTDLNVRSGPGTQYPVVGSIQGGGPRGRRKLHRQLVPGELSGGSGFASRNYLAMGGGAPGPAVAATPYVYDDEPDYGYYDYGYAYRPSTSILRTRASGTGTTAGKAGRAGTAAATGQVAPAGRAAPPVAGQPGSGFAGPPADWQRPGTGIGAAAVTRRRLWLCRSARRWRRRLRRWRWLQRRRSRRPAPAAPAGGGGAGFAGSIVRGGR